MTTVSDITNRLAADSKVVNSEFKTAVFDQGAGIIEVLEDGGYQAGTAAQVLIEADLSANAEVYTEGQALPAPVESTYVKASVDFKHFRAVIRESGHERRARGPADQGTIIADPERKMKRAIFAIRDLMARTYDDSSSYGLLGQISSTTNYLDQDRAVYTKLRSYVLNAASAAISTSLLNKFSYLAADTPYGASFDLCVCSPTQAHKLAELVSGKLALPDAVTAGSLIPTDLRCGVAPVFILPNLSNSVFVGMTGVLGPEKAWKWYWNEPEPGRFHVLDLGAAADTPMNLQISTAGAMVTDQPHRQGVITTLSTG